MSIENKLLVLRLNAVWQPIGFTSVKEAIVAMNSSENGEDSAAVGLDIDYPPDGGGGFDFDNPIAMTPVKWNEWMNLPIRAYDMVIHTSKLSIRVPTVIIAVNFSKMPKKEFRPTRQGVAARDGWICQYSGRKLEPKNANLDHVTPRDRGGKDTWENLVLCDKEINSKKGNKLNSEAGLKLIRQPKAPLPTPASAMIREARHFSWKHFLIPSK